MNKLFTLSIAVLLISTLAFVSGAFAQETSTDITVETVTATDLGVQEPSDGIAGFFQNLFSNIQYTFTTDPVKKNEIKLKQANWALLKSQKYLGEEAADPKTQGKYEKYLNKYQERMGIVKQRMEKHQEKIKASPHFDQFMDKLTDNSLEQQRLMDHLSNKLTEEQKTKLKEIKETGLKTWGEVINNFDDPEKITARVKKVIEEIKGSEAVNLEHLKNLQLLQNYVQEEIKEKIKSSQNFSVERLNTHLKEFNLQKAKEKLDEYFGHTMMEPIEKLKVLKIIEESPDLIPQIKQNLPAVESSQVQNLEDKLESIKNEDTRSKYLEGFEDIDHQEIRTLLQTMQKKYLPFSAQDIKQVMPQTKVMPVQPNKASTGTETQTY
ncbi:hypothetical protein KKF32_00880 [Patescibacteria group bacterium]|nr:hypothetical protein [Patescibacteria group bacterium]